MGGIRVGKPDVDTETLGHVKGVRQGNASGNYESQSGHSVEWPTTSRIPTDR